jgi:hypothetical protein
MRDQNESAALRQAVTKLEEAADNVADAAGNLAGTAGVDVAFVLGAVSSIRDLSEVITWAARDREGEQ